MLLHVPGVLSPGEAAHMRARLEGAPWADGRATAGHQSAQEKRNEQLPEDSEAAQELGAAVLKALRGSALFFAAALPKSMPPR
jgi:PKHD-type hydroxylase